MHGLDAGAVRSHGALFGVAVAAALGAHKRILHAAPVGVVVVARAARGAVRVPVLGFEVTAGERVAPAHVALLHAAVRERVALGALEERHAATVARLRDAVHRQHALDLVDGHLLGDLAVAQQVAVGAAAGRLLLLLTRLVGRDATAAVTLGSEPGRRHEPRPVKVTVDALGVVVLGDVRAPSTARGARRQT